MIRTDFCGAKYQKAMGQTSDWLRSRPPSESTGV
jgi:hypothetical protein